MKIVYMGTPDFAVPTLEKIVEAGHEVAAVVTQPDKAKGRGKKIIFSEVKEKALEFGLPVLQPVKARDPEFVEQIRALAPDCIVVVAFGQILPKSLLEIPKYGCVNVHGSLLPKYRGAAPIQWAVIDGEPVSGVTTMLMGEGLDTGDMLLKAETPIAADETGGSLFDRLSIMGADLLIETLKGLEAGTITPEPQDHEKAGKYAKMLTKEMGRIDFTQDAAVIECLIRGLNPWPSAYTKWNNKTLKIWRAACVACADTDSVPGQIIEVLKDGFVVKTGDAALKILEVQFEGKKRMDAGAFLRGCKMQPGDILGME